MTKNETEARKIIDDALSLNISVAAFMRWCVRTNNIIIPALNDEECINISANYPFPWSEIRSWFGHSGRPYSIQKPLTSIKQFHRGQIVRHVTGGESYVVDENYGNFVTAVTTKNIMNPKEWEIISQ